MEDKDITDRPSTPVPADDSSWSSDPSTIERRDAERPESGADAEAEAEVVVDGCGAGMRTPRRYEEQAEPDPRG